MYLLYKERKNKANVSTCDIPESLSLLQEAPEQPEQDQEQELPKQLKEQHRSAKRHSYTQPSAQNGAQISIPSLRHLETWPGV